MGKGETNCSLTSPDADLKGLLVEPPDEVAEVLLQQEGDLILQHLRRRQSALPASAATANRAEGDGECLGLGLSRCLVLPLGVRGKKAGLGSISSLPRVERGGPERKRSLEGGGVGRGMSGMHSRVGDYLRITPELR